MADSSVYSAAGNAALNLNSGFGAATLTQQVKDQTEEERRKRLRDAQAAGFSPAGQALMATSVF